MKSTPGFPLRKMALLAVAALTLGGCTANFRMPWEDNPLDPSRIATREPLEIPPNLSQLPPTGAPEVQAPEKAAPAATSAPTADSATAILFDTPAPGTKPAAPSRNENVPLPNWMSSSEPLGSKTAAAKGSGEAVEPAKKSAGKAVSKGRNAMTR